MISEPTPDSVNRPIDRRQFIRTGAAAGLSLGLASALPSIVRAAPPQSPSNRVRVAVMGTNSRGLDHIQSLAGIDDAEIVYVCDVEDGALAKGMNEVAKNAPGAKPKAIKDFRRALEDTTIDAIAIATPDHWHVPMAILALEAGKHVYLEKPCSHNPREGELLLEAISKYGRLVQMGNQRRSYPNVITAVKEIRDGVIGRAYYAKAWYDGHRPGIGIGTVIPVPPSLDYDLWQGPAPRRPYKSNLIHYNWHWFWHWGTGESCNNGVHELDVCRWALGVDFPTRVSSTGGRFHYKDDWQTPDTQMIGWDFNGEKSIAWEDRSCNGYQSDGLQRGLLIFGTEGTVLIDGNRYTVFDTKNKKVKSSAEDLNAANLPRRSIAGDSQVLDRLHVKNFIDAIRTGSPLSSPISEGHKSVLMPQLGNIAQRLGRSLECSPSNGHILHDEEAMKLWHRDYEPGWEPAV